MPGLLPTTGVNARARAPEQNRNSVTSRHAVPTILRRPVPPYAVVQSGSQHFSQIPLAARHRALSVIKSRNFPFHTPIDYSLLSVQATAAGCGAKIF